MGAAKIGFSNPCLGSSRAYDRNVRTDESPGNMKNRRDLRSMDKNNGGS